MVTIAEKQADLATCIDDFASMLDGLSAWSDADTYVTNDGSDGSWHNNGRVYENTNMGVYVLFYLNDTNNDPAGIRFHMSNDWDLANHHPAGKNNSHSYDPFQGDMGYDYGSSYDDVSGVSNDHDGAFLNIAKGSDGGFGRGYSSTYFLSASNNHLAGAIWNTTDSNNGASGAFCLEYVDNKFWDDSVDPFAYYSIMHHTDSVRRIEAAYGFRHISANGNNDASMNRVYAASGFQESQWGNINPDSNDDTFFYSKPIVYYSHMQSIPSSYLDYMVKNHPTEGASHGDTVTFNGQDYRCMKQSGAAYNTEVSCLIRFQ